MSQYQRDTGNHRLPLYQSITYAIGPTLFWVAVVVFILWLLPARAWRVSTQGVIILGVLGLWRYGWQMTNLVRAIIYRRLAYPLMRDEVAAQEQPHPERVYFMIPSYKEEERVSDLTFEAVVREANMIPSQVTAVISVAEDPEEDYIRRVVEAQPGHEKVRLVFDRQSEGKRVAMADMLRLIARERQRDLRAARDAGYEADAYNDVVIFMDGDTQMGTSTLPKSLGFFRQYPKLGALTTDELMRAYGVSETVEDWFSLKFVKRHHFMSSQSLSRGVMTLTGRFSVFRAEAVLTQEFVHHMEDDGIENWTYGRIRFLMGDDKSSWYVVLKNGWEMLYLPDVVIYSVETRSEGFFAQSRSLMFRWYGNMLRNNGRALRLGPRRTGFFMWWCILDQRLSMWTTLVAPVAMLLLALFVSPWYLAFYMIWVISVRLIQLWIYIIQGYRMRHQDLFLHLWDQWVGSALKINALFHLGKQKWSKKKGTGQSTEKDDAPLLRRFAPDFAMVTWLLAFILGVGVLTEVWRLPGIVPPRNELPPALMARVDALEGVRSAVPTGVVPNDGRDDAAAIQRQIDEAPAGPLTIELPAGELTFAQPLRIDRDYVTLRGAGLGETQIVVTMTKADAGDAEAAIHVGGERGPRVGTTTEAAPQGRRTLFVEMEEGAFETGDVVWIGAPNDDAFVQGTLGATAWNREYPYLRQTLTEVAGVQEGMLILRDPLLFDLPADADLRTTTMPRGVTLEGFTLRHEVPGREPSEAESAYANLAPQHQLSSIAFAWARDGFVRDVEVLMSGEHPLLFESAYDVLAERLRIDGAWNKGEGGTGYVRFARSHRVRLVDSDVANIRHVAFQWSASRNRVVGSRLGVDVNFHGGFSHHNEVADTVIEPAPGHPWPAVYRTDTDAHWAPPDGPNNRVDGYDGGV